MFLVLCSCKQDLIIRFILELLNLNFFSLLKRSLAIVILAGLEFAMKTRLDLRLWQFSCLFLLGSYTIVLGWSLTF